VVAEAATFIAAHALAAHIARRRHAPLRPEVVAV
jgi:hypothetical protein